MKISEVWEEGYNFVLISCSIKNCVYVSNLNCIYGFLSRFLSRVLSKKGRGWEWGEHYIGFICVLELVSF